MEPAPIDLTIFVVRIWHEWSLSGPRWYGRIEHVPSSQSRAFQQMDQMIDFVQAFGFCEDSERDLPEAGSSSTE